MRTPAVILACLLLVACGGGDNEPGPTNQPAENKPAANKLTPSDKLRANDLFQQAMEAAVDRNNSRAVELIDEAIRLVPDNGAYHARRAESMQALRRYREAEESYLRAAELLSGQDRLAVKQHAADCAFMQAGRAERRGDMQEALGHAQRATEIDPARAALHIELGHKHARNGDREAAAAAYQAAASVSSGSERHEAIRLQARAEFDAGNYNAARRSYTTLIDEGVNAYAMRGYCNVQTGRKQEAIDDFIQAIDRSSSADERDEYEGVLTQLRALRDDE